MFNYGDIKDKQLKELPVDSVEDRVTRLHLEKLDVIESCLNQVFTSIASIEATVSRIDSEVQVLNEKTQKLDKSVKEIEESVNLNEDSSTSNATLKRPKTKLNS